MDTLTDEQRHKNMAAIRSTGNKLETSLRSQLFSFGFRFRKNDRRLAGSPDIVFPRYRAVIFVNGCFWHAHGLFPKKTVLTLPMFGDPLPYSQKCAKFRFPLTNGIFWNKKFTRNTERDLLNITLLLNDGWRVGIVWECTISGKNRRGKIYDAAARISLWLEEEFECAFKEF